MALTPEEEAERQQLRGEVGQHAMPGAPGPAATGRLGPGMDVTPQAPAPAPTIPGLSPDEERERQGLRAELGPQKPKEFKQRGEGVLDTADLALRGVGKALDTPRIPGALALAAALEKMTGKKHIISDQEQQDALNPTNLGMLPNSGTMLERAGFPQGYRMSDIAKAPPIGPFPGIIQHIPAFQYHDPNPNNAWYNPVKGGMLDPSLRDAAGAGLDEATNLLNIGGMVSGATRKAKQAEDVIARALKNAPPDWLDRNLAKLKAIPGLELLGKIQNLPQRFMGAIGDGLYKSGLTPIFDQAVRKGKDAEGLKDAFYFAKATNAEDAHQAVPGILNDLHNAREGLAGEIDEAGRTRPTISAQGQKGGPVADRGTFMGPLEYMQGRASITNQAGAQERAALAQATLNRHRMRFDGVPEQTTTTPWTRPTHLTEDTPVYRGKHPENGKGLWTLDPNEAKAHAGPGGKIQSTTLGNTEVQADMYPELFDNGYNNTTSPAFKGVPRNKSKPAAGFPTTTTKVTPAVPPDPYDIFELQRIKTEADREAGYAAIKGNPVQNPVAQAEAAGARAAADRLAKENLPPQKYADYGQLNDVMGAALSTRAGQATAAAQEARNKIRAAAITPTDKAMAGLGAMATGGGTGEKAPEKIITGLSVKKLFDWMQTQQMPMGYALKRLGDGSRVGPMLVNPWLIRQATEYGQRGYLQDRLDSLRGDTGQDQWLLDQARKDAQRKADQ